MTEETKQTIDTIEKPVIRPQPLAVVKRDIHVECPASPGISKRTIDKKNVDVVKHSLLRDIGKEVVHVTKDIIETIVKDVIHQKPVVDIIQEVEERVVDHLGHLKTPDSNSPDEKPTSAT